MKSVSIKMNRNIIILFSTRIIGSIFFGANILAGISALLAVRLANRIGLVNTMVFTRTSRRIYS